MKTLKLLLLAGACALAPVITMPSTALAADEDTDALDKELDLYWAKKRDVRVIQKRLFLKESRHEFTVFGGLIPNDEFFTYVPVGGRYDFYFQEDFAIEVFGSYVFAIDTDLRDFLQAEDLLFIDSPQTLQWLAGASVLWSPIHGKFGIFTTKLAHFDLYLAFGAGVIGTTVIDQTTRVEESKVDVSGNVGLGVRFFLNDFVALRFDYRNYFYPAETGGVAFPVELTLGVSFFTSAPK